MGENGDDNNFDFTEFLWVLNDTLHTLTRAVYTV